MGQVRFTMKAKVWLYPGKAAWHFLSVPKKQAKAITEDGGIIKRGWGSVRVRVFIGSSVWETSIFPDRKTATYLLPLKASVRKKEGIADGDITTFTLEINRYNKPASKEKRTHV